MATTTTKAGAKAPVKSKAASKKAVEVKTLAQLQEELVKLRADHLESRRSHQSGEMVNPRILGEQRKSIARALTAIRAAQRAEAISAVKSVLKEEN